MRTLAVFTDKYLRTCGCSSTNFKTSVYFTTPENEIQCEIDKIIEIPIYFVIKQVFFLCYGQTSLLAFNWVRR